MFIKQIIVQGFKSYKDQTVIEPFSPGTNVIVGRNGSGKSNFFAAIRFVLSDAYTQMSREERQALLHEGSGSAVMSAYVEIIFDNSDDRFPTGGKEVILRRTIGSKKDEYSLDRKVVTKNDVVNLLEAAGFSRSNPYYIVPQGRVTALTNMKESDRLNLLKEVAGTQVYEARRAESLKIMGDTNNKRDKIDELLGYIKERLAELEEEKEELRGFQDKDRERRCLEYALYHQEQEKFQEQLDRIENIRQNGLEGTDSIRAELKNAEKRIAQLDAEINRLNREMELLRLDRRQLEDDRRETAKSRAKAELKVKSLADGQSAALQAQQQHDSDLDAVRTEIAEKQKELKKLAPTYTQRKQTETETRSQLEAAEALRQRLYNKQTRSSQFRNKGERDKYLRGEVEELHTQLSTQKANKLDADEEVIRVDKSMKNLEAEIITLRSQLEGFSGSRTTLSEDVSTAREAFDKLSEEKRELRRAEEKLENIYKSARAEREKAESELSHAMDGATARGLATIRRLKREKDIPGAYGTLAELLDVNEAYRLAVEQIAGASLFHYVVDNADTATRLAQILHNQRGGRVTFMPLDQLRPRPVKFPRSQGGEVVPLINKIKFDPKHEKAFLQVFGKAVVCPTLQIAVQYTKSHGVDAITLDGDQANKRGAMTGGYIDPKKSRLHAVQAVNKWRGETDSVSDQLDDVKAHIEQKEQEITRAIGEVQRVEQKLRQLESGFNPLKNDLNSKIYYLESAKSHLEAATKRRDTVEKNMKDFQEDLEAHEAELSTDFKKALSASEEKQLEDLDVQVQTLHKQWDEASTKRREVESRKQILEADLSQNLQLRLDQLNSHAFENTTSASGGLKEAQRELKKLQKATDVLSIKISETEAKLEQIGNDIDQRTTLLTQEEERQSAAAAKEAKQRAIIEKSISKKALYTNQATEAAKAIRDLGVLPDDFNKYERLDSKQIDTRLKKVRNALKKYQHVNKKAFEQYNSFTSQQDQLLRRRAELDASQESIEELVAHLDQRKDEAIERTFKQVSKEFATIFEKLVPAGHGRLVIQRRTDKRQPDPTEESEDEQRGTVENYTGVGISVSFNSKTLDEQQKIQQLSGGQKSLCALCLIFALQQTESSPMVIFDEVDANLDAQYRTAVAALLQSISRDAGTQFICTTFRPEIVLVADKCYGVTFHNKTSGIDVVPTEDALHFVEGQAKGAK